MYIPVKIKFAFAFLTSFIWLAFCFWISIPWIFDLAVYVTIVPAYIIVFSIALFPGFMYAFMLVSYLIDKRKPSIELKNYPGVSVLIAAYNEERCIAETLRAVQKQDYPGELQIILIDDGSVDNTIVNAKSLELKNLEIIKGKHGGKATALNQGLKRAKHDLIVTLDADTYILKDAIKEIVKKLYSGPSNAETVAVAGAIYVKNSRNTLMTRILEWDFFHAIAVIKRIQSLFQGTLVAQGAFSIYLKKVLLEMGGWQNTVGEDIVLTWGILSKGYRVDFAEKAICFTYVPETYKQFFFQRSRWARGLIEAFRHHPKILTTPRLSMFYIYWNMGVVLFDSVFFFIFIPG
ncbi:glycosyltransferase family 2 protein [Legionella jordanis]|nr:glycosyltransferase family 2 protein [Legionella jordanis]RMX14988.1 glycosyltransferase family 2 protein [Legionella jordanis]